jgi:hypothetical protein
MTDEPDIRTLAVEIRRIDELRRTDALRDERLSVERDRRLDQRMDGADKAVAAALAAAEKAVSAALIASEKAVEKAEQAQKVVNEGQNEFRGSLRDQAEKFMPRIEAESVFRELRALLATHQTALSDLRSRIDIGPAGMPGLKSAIDVSAGHASGINDSRNMTVVVVGIGIALLQLLLHYVK